MGAELTGVEMEDRACSVLLPPLLGLWLSTSADALGRRSWRKGVLVVRWKSLLVSFPSDGLTMTLADALEPREGRQIARERARQGARRGGGGGGMSERARRERGGGIEQETQKEKEVRRERQ